MTSNVGCPTNSIMPDLKPFEKNSAEHLRLVLETGNIGIWELDLQSGQAWRNRKHDEIFGYSEPLDEWTYEGFLKHIAEADRERVDQLQKAAIEKKHEWIFDCRITRGDGQERWISAAGRPLLDADGEVAKLIGHVIDITETKEKEERLALLTGELNHRVRNMLAMIKSMVRLTAAKAEDIPSFAEALEGRVGALARSQDLFVEDHSGTMTPSTILEKELSAFPELNERTKIKVSSETELLGAIGQGLALVFHELLTNAIKYGSLSNDAGWVDVQIGQDGNRVLIRWKERDGPVLEPQATSGFGTKLILGAIGSHGRVVQNFPPDGAECLIELSVAS